jgi:hypothetical protein
MPPQEECEHEMFVRVGWQDRVLAVPLSQLIGVDVDDGTEQAIRDWHTWVERGYALETRHADTATPAHQRASSTRLRRR